MQAIYVGVTSVFVQQLVCVLWSWYRCKTRKGTQWVRTSARKPSWILL